MAASSIAKIVGEAGEALFDGSPNFSSSDALNIKLEGEAPLQSGFALITDNNVGRLDKTFRDRYQVDRVTGDVKYRRDIDDLKEQAAELPEGSEAGGWTIINAALAMFVTAEVVHYGVVVMSYRRQK